MSTGPAGKRGGGCAEGDRTELRPGRQEPRDDGSLFQVNVYFLILTTCQTLGWSLSTGRNQTLPCPPGALRLVAKKEPCFEVLRLNQIEGALDPSPDTRDLELEGCSFPHLHSDDNDVSLTGSGKNEMSRCLQLLHKT